MTETSTIKVGDYVVIQRQKYTKLHKYGSLDSIVILGKQKISLRSIAGQKYFTTFKMVPNEKNPKSGFSLEVCSEAEAKNLRDALNVQECGTDNRNILDDGESQGLKADDIDKLRGECSGSTELIEKIVENSKTFTSKTQYSQEKYLKKKSKKYCEFICIRKPTIRLLSEIYYRQKPEEIMGIRMDTLSQIVSYSGISAFGNYLLYDSGSNGLLAATMLNSIGAGTEAKLVNLHPGNEPQKQAFLALGFPQEQASRCVSVNIYSVLRQYYQGETTLNGTEPVAAGSKRKPDDDENAPVEEKRQRLEEPNPEMVTIEPKTEPTDKKLKWQLENERAVELMKGKFDCLVIAAKEHPQNIIKALLPFLKPSRPLVIFNSCREVLMDIYVDLKASGEVNGLRLASNWLRSYQILPNRTHPEVNMNGNSGFIMFGYSVS
ncbi:unnamed protein product [Hermetia illucens]|uniref:tRNA (adenine(58)-N(1))-methyltransferase non-catalytic subunit TRM6 n=1 Tax=Hermetia illucens TaxID=343691 RepID=A0A7R8YUB4_HERIL|nr:tRNA (adenine(58)-N(1))-methyltransferase non-catalytic subunit TRM6 [Hermetia illucens]CAD7085987.1 unnamed protein product [Hermetia illucens]